ncbi:hypothetical protein GCM10023187_44330 [Nibrella viscosa]|uniref:histidine kinase n=2 Tax=Nibrella viscosa TaxID=1084524 RepID=A0ABP8KRR4_9BACT
MPKLQRLQVIDSLKIVLKNLNQQKPSFRRDTALFYTLDRYFYHYSQINHPHYELAKVQALFADSLYRIATRTHWQPGIAIATVWGAEALLNREKDELAFTEFIKAEELCEKQQLAAEQGLVLIHLAACLVYRKDNTQQQWDKAMSYMKKALHIAQQHNLPVIFHQYHNYMGDFYVIRQQYAEALRFYQAEEPLFVKYPNLFGKATNTAYLGICYLHLGYDQKAQHYFDKFFKLVNPDYGTYANYLYHTVLSEIGNYYLHNRKDYHKALFYQAKYERILPERPLFQQMTHYEAMYQIYEGLGNHKQALRYYQKFATLRAQAKTDEVNHKLKEIETRFNVQQKEAQIRTLQNQQLQAENDRQRTEQLLLFTLTALLILFLAFLLRANRLARKAAQAELRLSEAREETTVRTLEAQEAERRRLATDLHDDIGTSLVALCGQLSANEPARQLLNTIITDVRTVSHNLMPTELHDLGLTDALDEVARRLETASGIRFLFLSAGQPVALSPAAELTLYRLVQELMTNIVRHSGATEATVQFVYHEKHLNITVEDNGKGFDSESTKGGSGIGLKSLSSRVAWLEGQVAIDSGATGTTIRLDIPYTHKG